MARRLVGWLRSGAKLALVLLGWLCVSAAYKLVYGLTHDITRFETRLPIPYYQQQFLLEALLRQTWILGPEVRDYLGEPPSLGALMSPNRQTLLAAYCRRREAELAAFPSRHPWSPLVEEALEDACTYSRWSSVLALLGSGEPPIRALAVRDRQGYWRSVGLPDLSRPTQLARRLADDYPESPQAPRALLRVADEEAAAGNREAARAALRRLLREYPGGKPAREAAERLYREARDDGRLEEAREYLRLALAAEQDAPAPGTASDRITILGFRIDLAAVEVQLRRVLAARALLGEAARDLEAIRAFSGLDPPLRSRVRERATDLERLRSELWVEDLFRALRVESPGPPPLPPQHAVQGRVTVEGRPLSGVTVLLAETPLGPQPGFQATDWLRDLRFRAVSDRSGRFRIAGVPAGDYVVHLLYPLRPPETGGRAIVPEGEWAPTPGPPASRPHRVRPDAGAGPLPTIRFVRALEPRTRGEVDAAGKAVRLEWEPWPGAKRYRVSVMPALEHAFWFRSRRRRGPGSPPDPEGFLRQPVLWEAPAVSGTSVACPLLPLAPDQPQMLLFQQMHYEYRVTALDAAGRALAHSAPALGRFRLSPRAQALLLEARPPVRRRRRPPRPAGQSLRRSPVRTGEEG